MTRRILLTGAAGFIGSHTALRLLQRGDLVVGLDNLNDYYAPEIKRRNLGEVQAEPAAAAGFRFVQGDVRDRALLERLFAEPFDAVVHLAAMAGVRASVEDPWLYYDVNLTGTLNLLEAVRSLSPSANFVLASTSSAYGRDSVSPFVESEPAAHPLAPYPASKRAAEMLGFSYHHLYQLDFTALRFFTVYGPRGRPDMLAYKVLDSIFDGTVMPLYNGGEMRRDWTYVDDIVSGVVAAADRRLGYEVINLGRGEPVLLGDFVRQLERLARRRAHFVNEPMLAADVDHTFADIGKARRLLGYDPKVSVEQGNAAFYEWYVRVVRGGAPG
jgi:UDP-glucuronate 4-epimerase